MANKHQVTDEEMRDALEFFEDSQEGAEYNREAYYEDVRFARMSDQWPDAIKKQRTQEARPVLVINKLPALIRQVVNESRQNKPGIKVSPVDSGADEDTAEVISGLVRSIENQSNAEVAYNTAIDSAVTGGFGFFRIGIDYAHEETFDLECKIDRIPNALQVHWDTNSTAFDASDWEYAFVSDMLTEREYERRYPDASMVPFDGDSRDDSSDQWINEDQIRVAEYFRRVEKTRQIVQLEVPNPQTGEMDLQVVRVDDLPAMAKEAFKAGGIDPSGGSDDELTQAFLSMKGVTERRRRDVTYHEVIRRIINGVEVLEEDKWPGSTIPICPVWGDEIYLDGRRHFKSMIRDAKDSQMMFNFWRSATTELVALAPKAPWLGPKGFVPKGQEAKWASANTRSHAFLEYNQGDRPERQAFAGVPAGALQESISSNEDMQAITGIYPSSIGAQSNETSGKAIMARERQGDISNYHYIDNLARGIRYGGQVLVDIIPAVYSVRQSIRILGEDEAEQVVNLTQEAGGTRQKGNNGQPELYNLSVGKYDVTVSSGPSFATQREETRETLIEIMRQVPDAAPFIGDVLLDHMDFVGADKVAKRLKHLLPQPIRDAESEEVTGSDNPEAAAAQQELKAFKMEVQQAQEQVMAEIQKIQQENEQLKADKSAEMARTQSESEIKGREMDLKEAEAIQKSQEPVVTPEQQWDYNTAEASLQREHEAEQNALDREADLAKAIISKTENDDEAEDIVSKLNMEMNANKEFVYDDDGNITGTKVGGIEDTIGALRSALSEQAESDRSGIETAVESNSLVLRELIDTMSAPKRVIQDANGRPIGMETVKD